MVSHFGSSDRVASDRCGFTSRNYPRKEKGNRVDGNPSLPDIPDTLRQMTRISKLVRAIKVIVLLITPETYGLQFSIHSLSNCCVRVQLNSP